MKTISSITLFLFLSVASFSQEVEKDHPVKGPEEVIRQLFDLVTFGPGERPDLEKVRSLFIKEAVIVLRTSREGNTTFDVDGFIADWESFIVTPAVKEKGFEEKIIRLKPMVLGDMAQMLVLYEAQIPGSPRGPQQGVDNFLLIKRDGKWRIAAVTNEIPGPERPLPPELRN
jgi:hypothetical protein